jgi:4-hydroxy-2-oxoheptanedioate aldolase
MGLFLNSHSTTVAEQLSHLGYDWLLVDMQHGPMTTEKLSTMLAAIASGGAKSMVRVASYDDRAGMQQALDLGADGILVPYINTAAEAVHAVSCCRYPTAGTRSVYFPQRSTNVKVRARLCPAIPALTTFAPCAHRACWATWATRTRT